MYKAASELAAVFVIHLLYHRLKNVPRNVVFVRFGLIIKYFLCRYSLSVCLENNCNSFKRELDRELFVQNGYFELSFLCSKGKTF